MSIYDKINHIDQLTEWWESAEDAPANPGDRIIERHVCDEDEDTYYTIGVHRQGMRGLIGKSSTRILSRAPKPTPTWHDALAVVARTDDDDIRRPFIPVLEHDTGETRTGYWADFHRDYVAHALIDPVPLIEQKVNSGMVERANQSLISDGLRYLPSIAQIRRALSAALGIEEDNV